MYIDPGSGRVPPRPPRAPFVRPTVTDLGGLHDLTMQQSVPIGPGGFLPDAGRTGRYA